MLKQLYFRQALMMLDNQAGMNTAVGRGYSFPTTSEVPIEPPSQWVSSDMTENGGQGPYPYNPTKAKALLAAHGWKVVGGVLTCESAPAPTAALALQRARRPSSAWPTPRVSRRRRTRSTS